MNPMRCMGFGLKMAALEIFILSVRPGIRSNYGVDSKSRTRFRSGKLFIILLDKKFYFEFNVKSIIIQIL